jgi:hypothetical protein
MGAKIVLLRNHRHLIDGSVRVDGGDGGLGLCESARHGTSHGFV